MKRRIFGLENEYGLTCTLNGQRRLSPDNVARYLFEKVIPGARNANVFLENGARLYLDTGFHPEYATPECDDVMDLVVYDKAGERIVEDLLHQAEKRLREDGAEPSGEGPSGQGEVGEWTIGYTSGSVEGTVKATRDERRVGPCGSREEYFYKVNFRVEEKRKK